MDLNELSNELETKNQKPNVANSDMLAALVLIQGQLASLEKIVADNETKRQKDISEIKKMLQNEDKNISAMPVLTANIVTEKVDKIIPQITAVNETLAKNISALSESNAAFAAFLRTWIITMGIAFCIMLYLIFFN